MSSQAHIHQPPPDRTKEEFAFILYEYNVFTFSQLESMEKKKVKTVTWGKKKKVLRTPQTSGGCRASTLLALTKKTKKSGGRRILHQEILGARDGKRRAIARGCG